MLKTARAICQSRCLCRHGGAPDKLLQADAARRAKRLFPELADYESLFRNTGIKRRYACQPPLWYEQEHGWEEWTEIFLHHALDLVEEVGKSRDPCCRHRA